MSTCLTVSTDGYHVCKKWGVKVNTSKCKIMSKENDNIEIDSETIEMVDNFVFLGSVVSNTSDDVSRRIVLASSAYGRLKEKVWGRNDIPNHISGSVAKWSKASNLGSNGCEFETALGHQC